MDAAQLYGSPRHVDGAHVRPSLSVDCPASPPEKADITELAMSIAEELARLSRSPRPVGIDVSLKHSGLDPKTVSEFRSWLKAVHDYDASLNRLLAEDTTSEVIATDILASPRTRRSRVLPKPARQIGSGSFARSRRARSAAPRVPIFVNVAAEPDDVTLLSADVKRCAAEIGMAPYESWAGKKTSLIYGLLAIGLMGSPMSASHRVMKSPAVQSHLSPAARLRPIAPLEDPRAMMSTRTPVFASLLDSVRMPGVDLVQSPWVPDCRFGSLDGAVAELSFPRSPVVESM